MSDTKKTKAQLIAELEELRKRHAEVEYKTVIQTTLDGFCLVNTNGRFIEVNESYCKMVGYSREELLSMGISEVEAVKSAEETKHRIKKIIENGYDRFESKHRCKAGRILDVEVSTNFVKEFDRFVVFVRDITERKKAEEKLQNTLKKLSNLESMINRSQAMAFLWPIQEGWPVEYVSGNVGQVLGYTAENFMSQKVSWPGITHPDDLTRLEAEVAGYIKDGVTKFSQEYRLITKSGKVRWMNDQNKILYDSNGNPTHIQSIVIDITKRKKLEKALINSESTLRSIFDSSPLMMGIVEVHGNDILHLVDNESTSNFFGLSLEKMRNQYSSSFGTPQEHIDYWIKYYKECEKTGKPVHFTYNHNTPSGQKTLLATVSFISKNNSNSRFSYVVEDITERKKAEEEKERLLHDLGKRVKELNGLYNLEKLATRTKDLKELFHTFLRDIVPPSMQFPDKTISKIKLDEEEYYSNGEKEFVCQLSSPIIIKGKQRGNLSIGYTEDLPFIETFEQSLIDGYSARLGKIIEIIVEEENLQESEQKYKQLFSTESDAIMLFDSKTKQFIDINKSCELLYGYSKEEFLNLKIADISNEPEDAKGYIKKSLEGKFDRISIRYHKKKDGTIFPVDISVSTFKLHGQQVLCGIVRDITERRQFEEERMKAEKLESIGILAGGIAHDFNNILAAILGNISLAKISVDNKNKVIDLLTEAERASMQARELTKQLLTFSKGGAPIKEISELTELIRDTAKFSLRGSNVGYRTSIPSDLWSANVDKGQISQAINNLIINARQAMPEGGTINIKAENVTVTTEDNLSLQDGNYIKVTLKDQGTGVSEEHLSKIFDSYFTTKQQGSGLGLATTYSIIKRHDGHITVESEINIGTTFHIYLPASSKQVKEKEAVKEESAIITGKILVMDDEQDLRNVISEMLTLFGNEVEVASDGGETIELYKEAMDSGKPFDVVILDLTIPGGMGCKETITKLLEIDPDAKAIVSSGYTDDLILSNFWEYGFKGNLSKPYNLENLIEVLNRVMKKKKE